jgi:membrane protein
MGKAGVGSAYGAAGSLVAVLVWVYYSAQVVLFGAEFTHVYAEAQVASARERCSEAIHRMGKDRVETMY